MYLHAGSQGDELPLVSRSTGKTAKLNTTMIVSSVNARFRDIISNEPIDIADDMYKPASGYDGVVVIDKDHVFYERMAIQKKSLFVVTTESFIIVEKPIISIVFHELWENYERTVNNLPYMYGEWKNETWHNSNQGCGAHDRSIFFEGWFKLRSINPGVITTKPEK